MPNEVYCPFCVANLSSMALKHSVMPYHDCHLDGIYHHHKNKSLGCLCGGLQVGLNEIRRPNLTMGSFVLCHWGPRLNFQKASELDFQVHLSLLLDCRYNVMWGFRLPPPCLPCLDGLYFLYLWVKRDAPSLMLSFVGHLISAMRKVPKIKNMRTFVKPKNIRLFCY